MAAISVSGQWPYFRHPSFAPDIWGERNIDFIPCLETMGEYESANSWAIEGVKQRQAHPLLPLSMLANPGQGHFAYTREKAAYLALYIKKVMQYRMAKDLSSGNGYKLIDINPQKTGWLIDKWRGDQVPLAEPAPVALYKGDPSQGIRVSSLQYSRRR